MDNQEVVYGWNEDVYREIMISADLGLKEIQMMMFIMFQVKNKKVYEMDFDVIDLATFFFWSEPTIFLTLNNLENRKIITRSRSGRHNKSHGILYFNTNHNDWDVKYRSERDGS